MKFLNNKAVLILTASSLVGIFGAACEQPKTNVAVNSTNANSVAGANANAANTNSSNQSSANITASSGTTIDAKEPENYQASVILKLETSGSQQSMPFPPLKADVARNGNDRRMEFKLPTGETVIYLDKGGKQFLISPQKKQYAELNKESVGIDVRSLLMPEQIVNKLKTMKGVEQVGEETVDGRSVIKYRYASAANTQSQAGRVETESFILVDKETGLPLRSFTNSSAQGNVQGVNQLNLITEINNIRTEVDQNIFNEPTDFQKVAPEQVRGQINALFSVAAAVLGQIMKSSSTTAAPTPAPQTASPTATP